MRTAVLTISTSVARGEAADESGPLLAQLAEQAGAEIVAAEVVAESFRGKSRVQQHQMVYDALKGNMGGALHALALQTSAPE